MSYLQLAKEALRSVGKAVSPSFIVAEDASTDDLPPEWWVMWDERAAIMECDGKVSREEAEARARDDVLRLMRESREKPQI